MDDNVVNNPLNGETQAKRTRFSTDYKDTYDCHIRIIDRCFYDKIYKRISPDNCYNLHKKNHEINKTIILFLIFNDPFQPLSMILFLNRFFKFDGAQFK